MKVLPLQWLFKISISHTKVCSLIICMIVHSTFLELLKINTNPLLVKHTPYNLISLFKQNEWLNLPKSILLYRYQKKKHEKTISFMLNYKVSLKQVTNIKTLKDTVYTKLNKLPGIPSVVKMWFTSRDTTNTMLFGHSDF